MASNLRTYGRKRSLYQDSTINAFTLRAEWNSYYYIVRRAKQQCWAAFLRGTNEVMGESERCLTVLEYTKLCSSSTVPAPEDTESNQPVTMEERRRWSAKQLFPTH